MSEPTLNLKAGVGRNPITRLQAPADFELARQEHIAIMGPNGGGKSLLVDLLTGRTPLREGTMRYNFGPDAAAAVYENIRQITFEDVIGSVEKPYYYQQRFNSQDRDESPVLRDTLPAGIEDSPLVDEFMIRPLLDKRMVLLSSGEMRRYQLFKHLMHRPRVLIVDNPFIGLDAPMRQNLNEFFERLIAGGQVQIIMLLSMLDDVPPYMTHVVEVVDKRVLPKVTRSEYLQQDRSGNGRHYALSAELEAAILALPVAPQVSLSVDSSLSDEVVRLNNLSLPLEGERVLFGGLSWQVKRGEKWALQGRNGSGKSTLLSMICADHPAAYACDISLFGRRRGTGESIWDVKKHIGFVSPEFHRAYKEHRPAIEIVASGLHDTVGLYKRPRVEQMDVCRFWMQVFGIDALETRDFMTLSSGEQRLCLLARAFVKDPALLILDEPLHGLDTYRRERVRQVIDVFCRRPDKTFIMVSHYEQELPYNITQTLRLE